jgi:hypothetical protein
MRQSASYAISNHVLDLLSNDGIRSYYLAKEAIYAYNNTIEIRKLRKISSNIVFNLTQFLAHAFNTNEMEYITIHLFKTTEGIDSATSSDHKLLINKLKGISKNGFDLLKFENDIDIDIPLLKKKYKEAVFIHHPDRGGNTETMQILNDAYDLFFEYLLNYEYPGKKDIESFDEFSFVCNLIISYFYGDWCDPEKTLQYLLDSDKIARKLKDDRIGILFSIFVSKPYWIDRPTYALSCCHREKECKIATEILVKYWFFCCESEYKVWLRTENESSKVLKSWLDENKEVGKTWFTYNSQRFIIKTKEQANNMLRYKVISEKRYLESLQRIAINEEKRKQSILWQ